MAKKQFSKREVEKRLQNLSGWEVNKTHTTLAKSFESPSYLSGLAFVAKIAVHAEVLEHHPEITLSYGQVDVSLSTHDAKGLTAKDFELAERIDGLKM